MAQQEKDHGGTSLTAGDGVSVLVHRSAAPEASSSISPLPAAVEEGSSLGNQLVAAFMIWKRKLPDNRGFNHAEGTEFIRILESLAVQHATRQEQ